ncbi:hypothetical protein HPP92_022288 [Vanilla planifolia]|uniref:Pentatricopeptide repeat-containing protein n=1 Tax=Vanilla planifolia TaxID=51239 RepID=A0A835UFI1_VANPL|nr:hypothetical protein HPP92_022288 [Vanilla planifolia]
MATSTKTKLIAKRSSKYLEEALYRRLFREGALLRALGRSSLSSSRAKACLQVGGQVSIRKLRDRKCFRPALKLQETMARRGMNLTLSDHAIQLDLVAKARGISDAEEYFMNLQESAKNHLTYGTLLNCYCKELKSDKAEALVEKKKELNFMSTAMAYNSLMMLYSKTHQPERIPNIIQEMKTNDILPDCFTYNIWMRSLAAKNDISGVERVFKR